MAEGIVGEFLALKEETDADLLAMQCGDFYEFFGDDAEFVGEELDLKISEKSSHGSAYPMAGVPLTELTPYLKALVERGYRVAVADQYEVDGGHKRAIERVVTPGTLLETTDSDARYLAAIVREDGGNDGAGEGRYGLAFADVTTGRFHATEISGDAEDVLTECYRFAPAEILPGPAVRTDDDLLERLRERTAGTLSLHTTDAFTPDTARATVDEQFGGAALASVGLDEAREAIRAAGAVLDYVDATGVGTLASMTRLQPYHSGEGVALDATTQRNLELVEPMGEAGRTLLDTIDHTVTSAGGRLLREWLCRPIRARAELTRRADGVEALAAAALAREELREELGGAYDVERLSSKAVSGSADARDLLRVRDSLAVLPRLADAVAGSPELQNSPIADVLARPDRAAAEELRGALDDALAEDPPGGVREGGLIQQGYDNDLDELIAGHEAALDWIDGLADREKRRHSITHLSTGRNKTDGYYIQVGNSETDQVPESYDQIKSLKNANRYTTDELEEREREVFRFEERRGDLEYELFCELRGRVADAAQLLQDVGRALAECDCLASLAVHAVGHDWTRPELVESGLDIDGGRHPVVEQEVEFVPNDLELTDDRAFLVVTGPNMSGKSTYMRQTALITLLAQIGSFVPARSARIAPVDGIYTRVGALDELAQGRSTFMVEMSELANILHSATDESLVILDEVGRGTATYDGISIAWAATEYLHNEVRAKTLFATHYHELTGLAEHLDRVTNVHVAADERGDDVTFLRTVEEGPTDRSYGIHVADLAGVPEPVVGRSRDVLAKLRAEKAIEARGSSSGQSVQAVFDLDAGSFRGSASADGGRTTEDATRGSEADPDSGDDSLDPEAESVLDAVQETNIDETSPVELMSRVSAWQQQLDDTEEDG
ncbi:DNA mismatch repair protein MutS [Halococcus sp. PRR34]|uniref:DNA mismatch repair protein MutS n=1 Tax=Halococcus sp. PRR34 TaxID=3020830 RepID=UPI00236287DC|nr:DNA mismatch repair protein MutS [Halococcus sp. PRR34]